MTIKFTVFAVLFKSTYDDAHKISKFLTVSNLI